MLDEIKKLLLDIKISIDSIEDYLGEERDFLKYQSDKMFTLQRHLGNMIRYIAPTNNCKY